MEVGIGIGIVGIGTVTVVVVVGIGFGGAVMVGLGIGIGGGSGICDGGMTVDVGIEVVSGGEGSGTGNESLFLKRPIMAIGRTTYKQQVKNNREWQYQDTKTYKDDRDCQKEQEHLYIPRPPFNPFHHPSRPCA